MISPQINFSHLIATTSLSSDTYQMIHNILKSFHSKFTVSLSSRDAEGGYGPFISSWQFQKYWGKLQGSH